MDDAVKLCKDCKHYVADKSMATLDICAHPETQHAPDLVRGERQETYCDNQRSGGMCGKGGKYWEAK